MPWLWLTVPAALVALWWLFKLGGDDAPLGQLRVIAYTRWETDYGYVGRYPHRYQELQRKERSGWVTIDKEEVPEYVAAYNAVGGAAWNSKFQYAGTWGRDGIVTPHKEAR